MSRSKEVLSSIVGAVAFVNIALVLLPGEALGERPCEVYDSHLKWTQAGYDKDPDFLNHYYYLAMGPHGNIANWNGYYLRYYCTVKDGKEYEYWSAKKGDDRYALGICLMPGADNTGIAYFKIGTSTGEGTEYENKKASYKKYVYAAKYDIVKGEWTGFMQLCDIWQGGKWVADPTWTLKAPRTSPPTWDGIRPALPLTP